MGISMADIKEKLEVAYLEEDWHIVEELIESISLEIENDDDMFEQYKEDEEWKL